MKKVFSCLLLTFVLMLLSTGICQAASENPILMHTNLQFEDQKVGDEPYGFEWFEYNYTVEKEDAQVAVSLASAEVVNAPTGKNPDNKAMQLTGVADSSGYGYTGKARSTFFHLPIQDKGVISFSFKLNDVNGNKASYITTNMTSRSARYLEYGSKFSFITIKGDKAYFNDSTLIRSNLEAGNWYTIIFQFDVKTGSAKLYSNGALKEVQLPAGTKNITEVRFDAPTTNGSSWCIDNLRIYEADEAISDAEVDATWNEFTKSPFFIGAEYEAGKQADHSYLAYLASYQKEYTVLGTKKLFVNGQIKSLEAPFHKLGDKIMAPIKDIAENAGATVNWDSAAQKLSVSYKGHVMEVISGQKVYYLDQKPAMLASPVIMVNDTPCMQIDVLFYFLGKTYTEEDNILWFGEPMTFEWSLPDDLKPYNAPTLKEAVQKRLINELLFDWATPSELAEIMKARPRVEGTPRLEIQDFEEIKENKSLNDTKYNKIITTILTNANTALSTELPEYEASDGKRVDFSANVMEMTNLAFAYHVSDESETERQKYKDAIWRQIEVLATFPDLGMASHSLRAGQMCYGFYAAYDWLYDEWTPEQRKTIEDMLKRGIFDKVIGYNSSVIYHERDVTYGSGGNATIISNGGIALLALSMYETDPEYFGRVICGALRASEVGFAGFFPDGEWLEGISYWRFTMDFLPRIISGFQTACGTDFGLLEVPGMIETAKFPLRMVGAAKGFAFGDADAETGCCGGQMFFANITDDKVLAAYRKANMGTKGTLIDLLNWVFDTNPNNADPGKDELDTHCVTNSTIIMRTGWNTNDTAVAFHGGANNDGHGHMDVSSVQFDMNGVRFGMDLPRENYNLRDLGYYRTGELSNWYPNGRVYSAGHYYRQKGEGHNVVVANRQQTNAKAPSDPNSYDMKQTGKGEFVNIGFGEDSAFAVLNMTDLNDIFRCALRGVKLDKDSNIIEIQDDICANSATDFLWSMHTMAEIEISVDGKSAILTQNGKQVKATIINDTDMRFVELPAEFDDDYGTSVKPLYETPNTTYEENKEYFDTHKIKADCDSTIRKLAVKNPSTEHFKLAVTFQPYVGASTQTAEYKHFRAWTVSNSSNAQIRSTGLCGQ